MVCLHKQSFFVQISCYIAMITDKFGGIIDVDLQQKKGHLLVSLAPLK